MPTLYKKPIGNKDLYALHGFFVHGFVKNGI